MDASQNRENVWQYGTYEGAEKLRMEQDSKLTLSQKLDRLDEMLDLFESLHGRAATELRVAEESAEYRTKGE